MTVNNRRTGIKSASRTAILGETIKPAIYLTSYNIDIPRHVLQTDPLLSPLTHQQTVWVGPGQVLVAINMPEFGDKLNLCFVTEQKKRYVTTDEISDDSSRNLNCLRSSFKNFESRVQSLLQLAEPASLYVWNLSELPPLSSWVSETGYAVLVGDSAHAMLPYSGAVSSSHAKPRFLNP